MSFRLATACEPRLSIVIAAYDAAATLEDCIAALAPQCADGGAEILVVESGSDQSGARVVRGRSFVRLLSSPVRLHPGMARNVGVREARANRIAFIDADCIAAPDWVERMVRAEERGVAAVGGVVECVGAESPLHWAAYFCSFHAWMPGSPAEDRTDIPTCCLSVTREAFDRYGPFPDGYSSDTAFNWRMVENGERIAFDPATRVGHIMQTSWSRFVRRSLERGRAFAVLRVRAARLSPLHRAARALTAPLLPLVLLARLGRRAALPRFPYRRELARALPWVLVGHALWSVGEAVGYVRPGGA